MSSSKRRAFVDCLTYHRTTGIAGTLAAVLLITSLPAFAEPATSPGHAIANRFAEDAQRADAAREARRREAARKQAQQSKEEAARAAAVKSQKAHESQMLARARAEADERRKLEEAATRLDAIRAEREAREAEAERQRALKARQIEAAREAEQVRIAEEARKAEEARNAAEASRIATEEARRAEIAHKAEEEMKRAEAERLAAEARKAELAARAAENARLAEIARKDEELRKGEEIRKANEALRVAAERAAAEEVQRTEAEKRAAQSRRDIERATAEEARRVADIEADAEIARVADRLRRIREEHLAQRSAGAEPVPVASTASERSLEPTSGRARIVDNDGYRDVPLQPPRTNTPQQPPSSYSTDPKLPFDGRVTVLLQMEPRYRRGRRYESMDPVLCTTGGCYVSNGPSVSASFIYGRGAMRFGNAIGRRAGACNGDTTCVFRDVDLGGLPADVQPVDIRVIRHDRREPERVDVLSHCRATANDRLACTGAIEGDGYTMWVISEDDAERLPPHAFESVLASGFADAERADADPKLMAPRGRW